MGKRVYIYETHCRLKTIMFVFFHKLYEIMGIGLKQMVFKYCKVKIVEQDKNIMK